MAGKPYTMREMRAIVEYLTEHKAYGEIKGRKMWMEYASCQHTTRTWQSLKETFLKRIMPSLHDPYYKLSVDQVRSFRQGYDVEEKEKNKRLKILTTTVDSSSNAEVRHANKQCTTSKDNEIQTTAIDVEQPSTSIDKEVEKVTGEDVTCEKISSRNRSSADTVVLEYENAEDIQRALESPNNCEDSNESKSKSFKDLLTFEPMTPLVKEMLDDFETESESSDKEPKLHIDENPPGKTESDLVKNINKESHDTVNNAESVVEINDSEDLQNDGIREKKIEKSESKPMITPQSQMLETLDVKNDAHKDIDEVEKGQKTRTSKLQNNNKKDKSNNENNIQDHRKEPDLQNNEALKENNQIQNNLKPDNVIDLDTPESTNPIPDNIIDLDTVESNSVISANVPDTTTTENKEIIKNKVIDDNTNSTQNTGNTSSDTLLPNNQEALGDTKKATHKTNMGKTGNDANKLKSHNNITEKRSSSQDTGKSKKQKFDNKKSEPVEDDRTTPIIEILDTPIIENNTTSDSGKNTEIPSTEVNEIDTLLNNTENKINAPSKTSENSNKPRTSPEMVVTSASTEEKNMNEIEDTNPCLLSVSLFEEQFKNTKYSDSDSDDEATSAPKESINRRESETRRKEMEEKPQQNKKKQAEVIIVEKDAPEHMRLDSSSESPLEKSTNTTKVVENITVRMQREKALANVFGFAHGVGASTTRKRQMSHRRRSHHQHNRKLSKNESDSSEWTSESDSESYVSPPRGRKNRQAKKYLKPKSSRILQDPEEGMLYVIFGKNIYPLVKDGKHIKNFLTYRPDGSDMEEESYWKQKYVEEKKRVDEFKKLLKETRDPQTLRTNESTTPSRVDIHHEKPDQKGNSKQLALTPEIENRNETKNVKMVFKIAAKNGLECCLEGGWSQISNAMPQMVKLLSDETSQAKRDLKVTSKKTTEDDQSDAVLEPMEISSGVSTPVVPPVDPDVHEKVNKIETEIFKKIEELEKEEQDKQTEPETRNVTKRKVRQKKESSVSITSTQSPVKRAIVSKTTASESNEETTKPAKRTRKSKSQLNTPKEPIDSKQTDEKQATSSRTNSKTSTEQPNEAVSTTTLVTDNQQNESIDQKQTKQRRSSHISKKKETNGRLGVNEKSPAGSTKSSVRQVRTPQKYDANSSASDNKLRPKKSSKEKTPLFEFDENARYMFPPTQKDDSKLPKGKNNRSLQKISLIPTQEYNSVDSNQGYQDSDVSPMKICLPKRKRNPSLATQRKHKNRRDIRRKSYPTLLQDLSSDSNNSSYFIPLRNSLRQSSIHSEVYKTDSFQLLMPKQKLPLNKLAPIDEADPIARQFDSNIRHFNSLSNKSIDDNSNNIVEFASSSNVSFPISPELSVVEQLSISRELVNSNHHLTINEGQSNRSSIGMDLSECMISNLDVSVPLMNQDCRFQNSRQEVTQKKNTSISNVHTDAKLNRVCSVRIDNLTLSESLDQRLRDLLLESNKKLKANVMEVDQTKLVTARETRAKQIENAMEIDESSLKTTKKTKVKRSSTPRKKRTTLNAKAPNDPIIIEEYMESCSFKGRQSCPPVITFFPTNKNSNNCADVNKINKEPVKTRQKKDIIKVKIQRPKNKRRSKKNVGEKSIENTSTVSIYVDSEPTETDTVYHLYSKDNEDSVDLIHNHSETCLLANECVGDSVEFIDNSKSIISLNSTRLSVDSDLQRLKEEADNLSEEINARDKSISDPILCDDIFETPETQYFSQSASSLITEDLSDERPNQTTNWYLVSDEETTSLPNTGTYGANLNQIFPITCAVPNLSTISERSKENEDSKQSVCPNSNKKNLDFLSPF